MKISIIGCGRVFQHYKNLFDHSNSNIIIDSIYDADISVSSVYKDQFKISETFEALTELDSDLFCVLTPSGTHYELSKKLILLGKNVFVEKPLTLRVSDAKDLVNLAKNNSTKLFCGFQNRFNDAVQMAKKYVSGGFCGDLISAHICLEWCRYQDYYNDDWHGKWLTDGGVIAQQAIHHLDAMCFILGMPTSVVGKMKNVSNLLEAEDTFTGLISYPNVDATFSASTAFRPSDKQAILKISGTLGYIEVYGIAINKCNVFSQKGLVDSVSEEFSSGYGLSHIKLFSEIAHDIDNTSSMKYHTDSLSIDLSSCSTSLVSALYASAERSAWARVGEASSAKLGI